MDRLLGFLDSPETKNHREMQTACFDGLCGGLQDFSGKIPDQDFNQPQHIRQTFQAPNSMKLDFWTKRK